MMYHLESFFHFSFQPWDTSRARRSSADGISNNFDTNEQYWFFIFFSVSYDAAIFHPKKFFSFFFIFSSHEPKFPSSGRPKINTEAAETFQIEQKQEKNARERKIQIEGRRKRTFIDPFICEARAKAWRRRAESEEDGKRKETRERNVCEFGMRFGGECECEDGEANIKRHRFMLIEF